MPSPLARFVLCASCLTGCFGALSPLALAQNDPALVAKSVPLTTTISAVTIYPGRAAVTRGATLAMEPGVFDLTITGLPESIQASTLQARAGGVAKVLGVDYREKRVEKPADPKLAELDAAIEAKKKELTHLAQDLLLLDQQSKLLDAVSVRAANDATEKGGTAQLDVAALQKQIEFVGTQRTALLKSRRELDDKTAAANIALQLLQLDRNARAGQGASTLREAVVSVAVASAGQGSIELIYLVANALWEPVYNVRGTVDATNVAIEYDAMVAQRTGEDWNDVTLTLSTAQPTVAANPPLVEPTYVDVYVPPPPMSAAEGSHKSVTSMPAPGRVLMRAEMDKDASGLAGGGGGAPKPAEDERFKNLSADASVSSGGPAVTFTLPRKVTVKTNADRQQRTRIATIDAKPEFVHVASPLLTEAVYLRGTLTNGSAYQLLAGNAAIFLGGDFIGPTRLATVAPAGTFDLFFGIDRNLKATRKLVKKTTGKTGLLSGGVQTTWEYRIEIENPTGRAVTVELTDRMPVSRNEKIDIAINDLSVPLATDAEYVNEQKPTGILKWRLTVPASSAGAKAYAITYSVRMDHAKDVVVTGAQE